MRPAAAPSEATPWLPSAVPATRTHAGPALLSGGSTGGASHKAGSLNSPGDGTAAGTLKGHLGRRHGAARRSLTWAQGKEMALHADVTAVLLRQGQPVPAAEQREHRRAAPPVLPEGSDLRVRSADDLAAVAAELNTRPRRALGWTPPPGGSACELLTRRPAGWPKLG